MEIIKLIQKKINLNNLVWLNSKKKKWQVNLILINEKESKELNKKYNQKNYSADSLTFPFARFYQKEIDADKELGDIFVCYPLIKKQIQKIHQKKNPQFQSLLEKEIFLFFIHGVLHLFGCDHQKENERKILIFLQEKVLSF